MKKCIFAFAMLAGLSAKAAQVPIFKCQVPAKTSTVTATVSLSDDQSVDYVTVDLNDKSAETLFMQLDKGSVQQQITTGSFTTLVLQETFTQGDDGVIRNAGVLGLSFDQTKNTWSGLLSVQSNIYPLDCQKL